MINLYLLLLLRAPDTQPPSPYAATPTSIDSPAPKSDIDKIQDVCCAGVVVMPLIGIKGDEPSNQKRAGNEQYERRNQSMPQQAHV
jgi:hypothetical protein